MQALLDDSIPPIDMERLKPPTRCEENPEGQGVWVYMDKTFCYCPLPQISQAPVLCMDNPEGHGVPVYYDQSFYRGPLSQGPQNDGPGPAYGPVPFHE